VAIHSKNRAIILSKIQDRDNFAVASMSGGVFCGTGRLSPELADEIKADKPVYVVYSYGTPIGWVLPDNRAKVPTVSYSATTSAHQGIVRQALL